MSRMRKDGGAGPPGIASPSCCCREHLDCCWPGDRSTVIGLVVFAATLRPSTRRHRRSSRGSVEPVHPHWSK
ncbi:hypothetical protein MRX96_039210 [Rhipicephalus microplus]